MSMQLQLLRNVDPEAIEIGDLYRAARTSMVDSVRHLIETGLKLIAKKHKLGHGEWLPWLEANAEVLAFDTPRTPQRLIALANKYDAGVVFDGNEALQISREVWGHAGPIRGTAGTGENEWFTPDEFIDRARLVLGEIDLDPASSIAANKVVQAERYFTKASDGLAQEWHGRVWLNPPYAQPAIADFVHKLCEEWRAGRVKAAIALTHNYTDTTWFHELAADASAICFTRGRVKFYEGDKIAAPTQGQAFSYLGEDAAGFAGVFAPVGFVVCPWGRW